jgi:Fic family protein
VLRKKDTAKGFAPGIAADASMSSPANHALRHDGRLDEGVLSPELHHLILTMASLRNIVSSLLMEGAKVDFASARAVVDGSKPTTDDQAQLLRFAKRYRWIHDTEPEALPEPDLALAKKLHAELYKGQASYAPGKLKQQPNYALDLSTGLARFEFTPPARVEQELKALQEWLAETQGRLPAAIVAATWFAEWQAIHPFTDGNGRLGRLLNLLLLKKLGYRNAPLVPLDARFYKTSDTYYEKLAATNTGTNWQIWGRYYCDQLEKAYKRAVTLGDLRPVLDRQTSKPTRAVLEWCLGGGAAWFRRADFPNADGYSMAAITNALASLHEQGILEAEGEKKGRKYRMSTKYLQDIFRGVLDG